METCRGRIHDAEGNLDFVNQTYATPKLRGLRLAYHRGGACARTSGMVTMDFHLEGLVASLDGVGESP